MRPIPRKTICGVAVAAIIVTAAARGYELLGTTSAVVFGLVSAGVIFVVWRVFSSARELQRMQKTIALAFAALVFSLLAFPAFFSPDLSIFIEEHQIERLARSQLESVFGSSPRFADLKLSCRCGKGVVIVQVRGKIKTESDLLDLRTKIYDTCRQVSEGGILVGWSVTIEDSGITYNDKRDEELFPSTGG
jgi:magnesium-transporting ATPase (P-type)